MRSRAQVYGTTDIRANEEGAMQQRAAPGQRTAPGQRITPGRRTAPIWAMRRRGSRPHIDAVPDVRALTGFQRSSQTPMRQPEIDNEPIPQCGTRCNARRRAVRSRSRR